MKKSSIIEISINELERRINKKIYERFKGEVGTSRELKERIMYYARNLFREYNNVEITDYRNPIYTKFEAAIRIKDMNEYSNNGFVERTRPKIDATIYPPRKLIKTDKKKGKSILYTVGENSLHFSYLMDTIWYYPNQTFTPDMFHMDVNNTIGDNINMFLNGRK